MELKELRPNEQEKYRIAKEVVELGCTDTAIRRGRTKLGCTRKTLLKYTKWYKSGDLTLFSHRSYGARHQIHRFHRFYKKIEFLGIEIEGFIQAGILN